jgi:2-oxo-4-hydroxy-4-carboxy-5-ureidoimidazoline decarboxylase
MMVGRADLAACCASRRWVAAVAEGSPYEDLEDLLSRSGKVFEGLDWTDLREAVDAHPRIGQRPAGEGLEARWSRGEQGASATADAGVRAALVAGNREYERRFGQVFLIFATGLSATEILAELRRRLVSSEAEERAMVRAELRKIVDLRIAKLFGGQQA